MLYLKNLLTNSCLVIKSKKVKKRVILSSLIVFTFCFFDWARNGFLPFQSTEAGKSLWSLAWGQDVSLSQLEAFQNAFVSVAEKVKPIVVGIHSKGNLKYPPPRSRHFPLDEFSLRSSGSGILVDSRGYILTNNHVIEGGGDLTVTLSDGRKFSAKVVGQDAKTDLAIVKIEIDTALPTAALGDSSKIRIGEWAIAIGNPFSLDKTVTVGVISGIDRSNIGIADYEDFIQTDASINPGNSGGPLLNLKGEVIGINTAIIGQGRGIGFAIPINMAKKVLNQLITHGKVVRGYLGVIIEPVTSELIEKHKLKIEDGVLVSKILENSPAEKGGLKTGDIILEFNGSKVKDIKELQHVTAETNPGEKVDVKIFRNDREEIIKIEVAELPDEKVRVSDKESSEFERYGINVQDLTPEIAEKFDLEETEGVLITNISENSMARNSNLRRGDAILEINKKKIKSVQDFEIAFDKVKKGEDILLLIAREKRTLYVVLSTK
jgi:serine protease Do